MRESIGTDRIYAVVALVAAVLGAVEAQGRWWAVLLLAVALVPWALVAAGRAIPLPVFAALALVPVAVVVAASDVGSAVFATTAAASRVASRTDDRRVLAGVTLAAVVIPVLPVLTGHPANVGNGYFAFGDLFGVLVGVLLRRATRLAGELRQAQARLAEAAGVQERQRIARDVHDLVAHSLTVVVLHVGGARRVLRSEPQVAERALAEAERVCRESLDGIRGVVGLLRDPGEVPAVSLDLAALLETYRAAGLDVVGEVPDLDGVPLAVRVTVFRVVQEALANAARHGSGGTTRVEVHVGADSVVAHVVNPATGGGRTPQRQKTGGYGLAGLREQVAARGGTITSGREGGRWVVSCSLPARVAPIAAEAAR